MSVSNFRNLILDTNRVVLSALISALIVIISVINPYVIIGLISLIIIRKFNMHIKN